MKHGMLFVSVVVLLTMSCSGPRAVRSGDGTGNTSVDNQALSTKLDKVDLDYLADENTRALFASGFWNKTVERSPQPPRVAIWPIQNRTAQHVDDQMDILLRRLETTLVNSGDVAVVARDRQESLLRELGIQQSYDFDPATAGQLGAQLGVEYFLTGRITSVEEKTSSMRRVQYTLFIQVLNIETGQIGFQNDASRTKALKR